MSSHQHSLVRPHMSTKAGDTSSSFLTVAVCVSFVSAFEDTIIAVMAGLCVGSLVVGFWCTCA